MDGEKIEETPPPPRRREKERAHRKVAGPLLYLYMPLLCVRGAAAGDWVDAARAFDNAGGCLSNT